MTRGGIYGSDVPYSEDSLVMMHNADLADTLGNLLHRAANLALRMCEGVVPDVPAEVIIDVSRLRHDTEVAFQSYSLQARVCMRVACDAVGCLMRFCSQAACEHAINAVKDINKYLTDAAPWAIKEDSRRKAIIVRSTLEALYVAAHFLAPFIPTAAETIFARLGTTPQPLWSLGGGANLLKVGTPVTSGDILFAKFEREAPEVTRPPPRAAKPAPPAADAPLDVSRLDIRVGQVLKVCAWISMPHRLHLTLRSQVERHAGAEHLYVESIDLGDESGPRTVVSGLVKFVSAEELQGSLVVCLCNLKPAAMRGVVSQAMVLCASDEAHTRVELVKPPAGAVVGERVTFAGFAGQPDAQLNPKKKVRSRRRLSRECGTHPALRASRSGRLCSRTFAPTTPALQATAAFRSLPLLVRVAH